MATDFISQVQANQADLGSGTGLSGLKNLGGGSNTAFDLLNPSTSRLSIAGLLPGGLSSLAKGIPNIGFLGLGGGKGGATSASEDDWRVRVSLSPNAHIFYQDVGMASNALMSPLIETNGVIWPYTPTINVTHSANYSTAQLTHSNYPAHFYNYSEVADINISGEFTVQTVEDGQYLMAAIYFFRSATKMFFGQGANMGNPPPIVFLDGYGSHYFPHVPCVVTSFQHSMPSDPDYVEIPISSTSLVETAAPTSTTVNPSVNNGVNNSLGDIIAPNFNQTNMGAAQDAKLAQNNMTAAQTKVGFNTITTHTRVPTVSTITVTLKPMYSRKNLHDRFNLDDFAQGKLIKDAKTGLGGFL